MSVLKTPSLLLEVSPHSSAAGVAERAKVTSETPLDNRLVGTAPAHHAVPLNVGALLNK